MFLPGLAAVAGAGKWTAAGAGERKMDMAAGQVDAAGGLCSADFWTGGTGSGATDGS